MSSFKGREMSDQIFDDSQEFEQLMSKTRELFGDELRECVRKVVAVDKDEARWRAMVDAPVVPDNEIRGTLLDMEVYASRFRRVLRNARSHLAVEQGAGR